MSVEEIIRESESLSAADRARLIDSLLHSFHRPNPEIERQWLDLAQERLAEVESGEVAPIPGEQVLAELRELTRGE